MTKRKFTQVGWMPFILMPVFSNFLLRFFQTYFNTGIAMLISIGLMVLLIILVSKLFLTVVTFKDSFLQLKKGLFRKEIKINYADINKITFTYNRFLDLWIYTADSKIKIPPPSNKLEKAKELFAWLRTKNPGIIVDIIK